MASYTNPIFYSEAADSAVQPDVVTSKKTRSHLTRARSRSPPARLGGTEDDAEAMGAETKTSKVYDSWRLMCRDLFWRVMEGLLKRPLIEEEKSTSGSANFILNHY